MFNKNFRHFDVLSEKTTLFFQGSHRYFSLLGVIWSTIFTVVVLGFGLDFILSFIERKNIQLLYSKDGNFKQINADFHKKLFFFEIRNENNEVIDPRAIYIEATLSTLKNYVTEVESLVISKCSSEEYNDERYKKITDMNIANYQCFHRNTSENSEIPLETTRVPPHKNYVSISIKRCQNKTEKKKCFSEEKIDEIIAESRLYFYFYTEILSIDNYKSKPVIRTLYSERLEILPDQSTFYDLLFRKVRYESDEGIMIENKKIIEDFGFVERRTEKAVFFEKGTTMVEPYLNLSISIDDRFIEVFQREYLKIQTFGARFGGMAYFFFIFFKSLTIHFSEGYIIRLIDKIIGDISDNKLVQIQIRETITKTNTKNNFFKASSSTAQVEQRVFPSPRKRVFSFHEILCFKCLSNSNSLYLKGIEQTIHQLLDVKSILAIARQQETNKIESFLSSPRGKKNRLGYGMRRSTSDVRCELDMSSQAIQKKGTAN